MCQHGSSSSTNSIENGNQLGIRERLCDPGAGKSVQLL
jgi:hypothetical protein